MKRAYALALLFPLAIACGSSTSEPKEHESDIVGGTQANGRALDAIGSLGKPLHGWPTPDTSTEDAGVDASAVDAEDGGAADGGATEEGVEDGGATEEGVEDGGAMEEGAADGGANDGGGEDDDAEDGGAAEAETPPTFRVFCTATLVAPKLVVTAKHCVDDGTRASDIAFNIGPDGTRPTRTARVANIRLAPLDEGGFVKLGADVAILELAEEIDDIAPLPLLAEPLEEGAVGARFSAVGYGIRDRQRTLGNRVAGTLTLRATEGLFAQKIFGSLEELVAFAKGESPEAFGSDDAERLRAKFWNLNLLSEYEAFLGLADGDAQPCSGDSGGPLVARMGGELVVTGVVSGSFKLSKGYANPCSVLGEVYATFGPVVQTMFDEAQAAAGQELRRVPLEAIDEGSPAALPDVPAPPPTDDETDGGVPGFDRCRGLNERGVCEEGAVLRCIAPEEGPPRATRTDCTLLLSTCKVNDSGAAECVDL